MVVAKRLFASITAAAVLLAAPGGEATRDFALALEVRLQTGNAGEAGVVPVPSQGTSADLSPQLDERTPLAALSQVTAPTFSDLGQNLGFQVSARVEGWPSERLEAPYAASAGLAGPAGLLRAVRMTATRQAAFSQAGSPTGMFPVSGGQWLRPVRTPFKPVSEESSGTPGEKTPSGQALSAGETLQAVSRPGEGAQVAGNLKSAVEGSKLVPAEETDPVVTSPAPELGVASRRSPAPLTAPGEQEPGASSASGVPLAPATPPAVAAPARGGALRTLLHDVGMPVLEESALWLASAGNPAIYAGLRVAAAAWHAIQKDVAPPQGPPRSLLEKVAVPSLLAVGSIVLYAALIGTLGPWILAILIPAHIIANRLITVSGSRLQKGVLGWRIDRTGGVQRSIRQAYPQTYPLIEQMVADKLGSAANDTIADIEVHGNLLRVVLTNGEFQIIPFDAARLMETRHNFHNALRSHPNDYAILTLTGWARGLTAELRNEMLGLLEPYYRITLGKIEKNANPFVYGTEEFTDFLTGLLGYGDLADMHEEIKKGIALVRSGQYIDYERVLNKLRSLRQRLETGHPEKLPQLDRIIAVIEQSRRGAQPVLVMPKMNRVEILRGLGLGKKEIIAALSTPYGRKLIRAAGRVAGEGFLSVLPEPDLMRIVTDLREFEFINLFFFDKGAPPRPRSINGVMAGAGLEKPVVRAPESSLEALRMLNYLSPVNSFVFTREMERALGLDIRGRSLGSEAPSNMVVGFFPGLASRSAYRNLGTALLESGRPDVLRLYQDAAAALGLRTRGRPDPTRLLLMEENLPTDRLARQAFIGTAFIVHNLALNLLLQGHAQEHRTPMHMMAYTGEDFGILTAAIAAGSLSVADGVRIAQFLTPALLEEAGREVSEAHHVLSLQGPNLERVLAAAEAHLPGRFEVHRMFSGSPNPQVNVYVPDSAIGDFRVFMNSNFPEVQMDKVVDPTFFVTPSVKMRRAREALRSFIDSQGIVFRAPRVPIISNNGTGVLTRRSEVLDAVLAIVDEPMDSRETVRTADALMPDMIVELGLGGKARALMGANHVEAPFVEFDSDRDACDAMCKTMSLLSEVDVQLEALRALRGDLQKEHYGLLRRLFENMASGPFAERFLTNHMRRIIDSELLDGNKGGSPAFYRFLEIYQYTQSFKDQPLVPKGALVTNAIFKKRILGTNSGKVDAELVVLAPEGSSKVLVLPDYKHPETVVYAFHQLTPSFRNLGAKTRELIETQPLARDIYEQLRQAVRMPSLEAFTDGTQVASVAQLTEAMIAYQYVLFRLMQVYRPAVFAQNDYYVAGTDETGWLAALAASGAASLSQVIQLGRNMASGDRAQALSDFTALLKDASIPILAQGSPAPLRTKAEIGKALAAMYARRAKEPSRPMPIPLSNASWVVSLDPGMKDEVPLEKGGFDADFIHIADPAEIWSSGSNSVLDAVEEVSTLVLTDERGRVLRYAKGQQMTTSDVYSYVNVGERILGFGNGGSGSLVMRILLPNGQVVMRKVLSEALITAKWDRKGKGVMAGPVAKAEKQARWLSGLPEEVQDLFPRVEPTSILGREVEIPEGDRKPDGLTSYTDLRYDMSLLQGKIVSDVVRDHRLPPAVVARLYGEIFRVLRQRLHAQRRRSPRRPTLESSYFKKIEDRLALSQRTAPRSFSDALLKPEHITVDGQRLLNIGPLLKRFREHPEYLEILEPRFHSLVMGDTNTENIMIEHVEPLVRAAQALAERGEAPAFTAEDLGIRFLDPRAIGYHEDGRDTGSDDPMYDNKPWHNPWYDEIHQELFDLTVNFEGGEPHVARTPRPDSPYRQSYERIWDFFAPTMTRAFDLDNPGSQFLKDDPYWLIRFAFVMGTHFAAMPPFHFTTELDGTMLDDYQHQRRPVAIYAEGVRWLNLALDMLEGRVTEFHGIQVPRLPHRSRAPPAASAAAVPH